MTLWGNQIQFSDIMGKSYIPIDFVTWIRSLAVLERLETSQPSSEVVLPSLDGDWFMFSSCFQHRSPNLSCCFFGGGLQMVPNGMAPSDIAKKHFFFGMRLLGLKQKAPKHQSRLSTCTTPSPESVLPTVIEPLRLTHYDL
jgi:hypothetical protein